MCGWKCAQQKKNFFGILKEHTMTELFEKQFQKAIESGNVDDVNKVFRRVDASTKQHLLNFENESNQTALFAAVLQNNLPLVEFLLNHGSVWNHVDSNGKNAGELAMENGFEQIESAILSHALRAELILDVLFTKSDKSIENNADDNDAETPQQSFLKQKLSYVFDDETNEPIRLLNEQNDGIYFSAKNFFKFSRR